MPSKMLKGPRNEIAFDDGLYPEDLRGVDSPPQMLYIVGNPEALQPGLAVIGARKATPYGRSCARRFARIAAEKGVTIVSGGARGCDSEAHRAALEARAPTVVFLGGGCDRLYPPEHVELFQRIVDAGGAVVSEHPWDFRPLPYTFRARNRLIAGLARAVLIVEAGLPSGTFSTADEALGMGKEVLVVPGSIASPASHGSNRLLYQGAMPVVDDESFEDILFSVMGALKRPDERGPDADELHSQLIEAIIAQPLDSESILALATELYGERDARPSMMVELAAAEAAGIVARYPDGRWGPRMRT